MKIVYCSTPPFADCDLPLIKALGNAGHKVCYLLHVAPYSRKSTYVDIAHIKDIWGIFPASDYPELSPLVEAVPDADMFVVNNPEGKNNLRAWRLSITERRFISAWAPDVLHYVESPAPFHLPLLWWNRSRAVCVIHDPVPHLHQMKRVEYICRRLAALLCKKFVLLSHVQTDSFCRMFKVKSDKLFYAALGPYEIPVPLAREGKIISDKYILMFGRITPYKGFEKGIALMDKLTEAYPDVSLVMAGAGTIYFDPSLMEGKPYIRFIHRYITVEEQSSLVRHALFVLCPYAEATQSGVVQTAFGMGTPVVVTDVGALSEAVKDGETGKIVPPEDEAAMENAVRHLLDNPDELGRMRNHILVENESGAHSWKKIAEQYIKIYRA